MLWIVAAVILVPIAAYLTLSCLFMWVVRAVWARICMVALLAAVAWVVAAVVLPEINGGRR